VSGSLSAAGRALCSEARGRARADLDPPARSMSMGIWAGLSMRLARGCRDAGDPHAREVARAFIIVAANAPAGREAPEAVRFATIDRPRTILNEEAFRADVARLDATFNELRPPAVSPLVRITTTPASSLFSDLAFSSRTLGVTFYTTPPRPARHFPTFRRRRGGAPREERVLNLKGIRGASAAGRSRLSPISPWTSPARAAVSRCSSPRESCFGPCARRSCGARRRGPGRNALIRSRLPWIRRFRALLLTPPLPLPAALFTFLYSSVRLLSQLRASLTFPTLFLRNLSSHTSRQTPEREHGLGGAFEATGRGPTSK